jgi:hypothetical protein
VVAAWHEGLAQPTDGVAVLVLARQGFEAGRGAPVFQRQGLAQGEPQLAVRGPALEDLINTWTGQVSTFSLNFSGTATEASDQSEVQPATLMTILMPHQDQRAHTPLSVHSCAAAVPTPSQRPPKLPASP